MLEEQEKQQGKIDLGVFHRMPCANKVAGGFDWDKTEQGWDFWFELIMGAPRKFPRYYYNIQWQYEGEDKIL